MYAIAATICIGVGAHIAVQGVRNNDSADVFVGILFGAVGIAVAVKNLLPEL